MSYFFYTFIIHFAGKRIFKIDEHLAKLQAKWLTCVIYPIRLALFVLRDADLAR